MGIVQFFKKVGHGADKAFKKNGSIDKFFKKAPSAIQKGLGTVADGIGDATNFVDKKVLGGIDKGLKIIDKLNIPVLDEIAGAARAGVSLGRQITHTAGDVSRGLGQAATATSVNQFGNAAKNTANQFRKNVGHTLEKSTTAIKQGAEGGAALAFV